MPASDRRPGTALFPLFSWPGMRPTGRQKVTDRASVRQGRIPLLDRDQRVLRTLLFTRSWYPGSPRLPLLQRKFQIQRFVKQEEQVLLAMQDGVGKTSLQ